MWAVIELRNTETGELIYKLQLVGEHIPHSTGGWVRTVNYYDHVTALLRLDDIVRERVLSTLDGMERNKE